MSEGLSFADYVAQTQTMIRKARIDITDESKHYILEANSPFMLRPKGPQPSKRGVLLIHGLYDSPFIMRDIGYQLQQRGFLVYAIVLPGHGTVPGDLLKINYHEWIKATQYGVTELAKEVDQIYIAGFSIGATLALNYAAQHSHIAGLILLAPAFQFRHQLIVRLSTWFRYMHGISWYKKSPLKNYAKYESYCFNAGFQTYQLVQHTKRLLDSATKLPQLFAAISAHDEVVVPQEIYDFFSHHPNPKNRLLIYSSTPLTLPDPRVEIRNCYFPEQKILDFAHTSLPVAPDNPHYGVHGDYQDFNHYPNSKPPANDEIYFGSFRFQNIKQHTIQRLTYNPDFYRMMKDICQLFS